MDETRPAKALVKFDDFARLDLRVARVVECREHPNADKLLVLKIDLGPTGAGGASEQRQICAGLKNRYQPGDLVGKLVIVVANLEARSMRGETSQGVLLTASHGPLKEKIVLLTTAEEIPPGSAVS